MIKIEYIAHTLLFIVLSFFYQNTYLGLLVNLPIIIYHAKRFFDKTYLLDASELYNEVKSRKTEAITKIIYYLVLFIFYLGRFFLKFSKK
jgi:protein cornichon